jgi:lipopolysaccharide transport system ATP-binding protein
MSDDIAICVKGLGKKYTLSGTQEKYLTLRDAIVNTIKTPFQRSAQLGDNQSVRDFWALKDISFNIYKGEVVGIIGRNGAGKSTLLKILSRITMPTEGKVDIHGRVGSLLEVGTGFHPELTGRENILLAGSILGMKRRELEDKFGEIVKFSEIEKFLDTPVKRYSSGMYIRLAFAVAAHLDTEILLIDEVLAVGDAAFQKKCLGKMGAVAKEGRTVLFVSHNMNAVEQLCQSCILLKSGKIENFSKDVKSVTRNYLFDELEKNELSEWKNSGADFLSPYFKPIRFYLSDQTGNILEMSISNSDEIYIAIEGEITILDPLLTIGYAIYSEDGNLLYWSYQTDTSEEEWPKLKKGFNCIKSQIPKRLLNQGNYRLEFISSLHFKEWLCQPGVNTPTIFLKIQGGLSDSPYWMIQRPGLLAPVMKWENIDLGCEK